jgi:hypothetical protein
MLMFLRVVAMEFTRPGDTGVQLDTVLECSGAWPCGLPQCDGSDGAWVCDPQQFHQSEHVWSKLWRLEARACCGSQSRARVPGRCWF